MRKTGIKDAAKSGRRHAKEVKALAQQLKNNYKFKNVGIEAVSLVPQPEMS